MRRLSLALVAAWFSVACSRPLPLSNTHQNPDAVATAVLEALARRDREQLQRLALTEEEFRAHVWPDLPAARPERNLPFSYVWGDLKQKSEFALSRTVKQHDGRRYTLVRTTFSDETNYPHYTVHRQASLVVRDESGAESTLRICGSMIEKDGAWKVFSYVVDD